MVSGVLELGAVQAQAYQPHPEGKQLIVAVCFLHDRAALIDRLGGHRQAQVDIRRCPPRMEGGVETAEFHSAPVKDRVEV